MKPSDQIVEVMADAATAITGWNGDTNKRLMQAALSALKQAGWRVVPKDPTDAMFDAGEMAAAHFCDRWSMSITEEVWEAMLQAHEQEEQGSSRIPQDRSASGRGAVAHAITDAERVEEEE